MTDNSSSTPQFNTAEYASKPGANSCRSCNRTITGAYYRVNGALACPDCAQRLESQLPKDSHSIFTRALLFGFGAAILGLIIYATFGIVTGWMIGYVSLAVGYIVGKAMLKGSGGIGGRKYQIAAVLLTYFAVSMAAIPIGISQIIKEKKEKQQSVVHTTPKISTASPQSQEVVVSEDSSTPDPAASKPSSHPKPPANFGAALAVLLFAGLASPFLELVNPLQGLIGLVILFVGLRIAWKLTAGAKIEILGPFGTSVPPPPLG
jgi:hypothetical protein